MSRARYMKVQEVLATYPTSRSALFRLRRAGKIRAHKVPGRGGGEVLYHVVSLETYFGAPGETDTRGKSAAEIADIIRRKYARGAIAER